MVILYNSRTLGAFERQSRHLKFRLMKTKEVTISNIKFNLSTKPLVSEPETYPDYPSVPDNQ